ncbi:cytosolic carboxypeptidase-like protein 5 [Adelges cooleyi]|uniref:cytosolic carboxypeptidase-like protein 5 n=1 Tax=Adelges cooleyi TaxID=133065 RepID=UPI00218062A0|nr:cytosolic carboxypeptidase-like protein 5 [Adelges cooleyi]XP_050422744.1 cytosolic carboxypeptidase-like protein 5 [Adelges cooleyi]XP_050422746.1 cytosolic carboxypeptidase-like protein 5 [Adelges cooleyi]
MNVTSEDLPEIQPGVFTYELFTILSNFESANLAQAKCVRKQTPGIDDDLEFYLWTKPDCGGTEFECNYRSWFYFAIKGGIPGMAVRLNLISSNKQSKMYSQGMAPVCKVDMGKSDKSNTKFSKASWSRIKEIPIYQVNNNHEFVLSFSHRSLENPDATTYYAFTYPYTYTDLCTSLNFYEKQFPLPSDLKERNEKDIYFHRETIVKSLEDRSVDLVTITSFKGASEERECRLFGLFPDENKPRPYVFKNKKVIIMSARVHPGETPSSFVMNGLIKYLLSKDEQASVLRQNYVFKLIPMLNPDGVARGFYRTDTRGINLNRFYLKPSLKLHPSIYAARSLILYHHFGYELRNELIEENSNVLDIKTSESNLCSSSDNDEELNSKIKDMLASDCIMFNNTNKIIPSMITDQTPLNNLLKKSQSCTAELIVNKGLDSGLYLYVDFHGHASKKGIFMYGNNFDNILNNVECMVYPKLMSINNQHFHYTSCNFSERNMYSKDKKFGLSKEGSGRVAVLKYTGLIRSYTLECNYNTGRFVNLIPHTVHFVSERRPIQSLVPPKFTPTIYEQVGKSLCISILDLSNINPNSRLDNSEFKTLAGLREHLRSSIINDCSRNRRMGSRSLSNIIVETPSTPKTKIKPLPMAYDIMKPTTSKLLTPIMTKPVPPLVKSAALRKTLKTKTGGILKKNGKKWKMNSSKQKAIINTAENSLKLWRLGKKIDLTPLRILGVDQQKNKK